VIFYGVVSAQTEKVVEFFFECDAAEAMIGQVSMTALRESNHKLRARAGGSRMSGTCSSRPDR
jgi:hypothetical protein